MSAQPTIRDVATRAGVSIATVSRVLNCNRRTTPALRVRVLEAVKALDYSPNPAMAAMAARHFQAGVRKQQIPLAYVMQLEAARARSRLSLYFTPFCHRAIELGYRPELHLVEPGTRPAAFRRMLYQRGVAGVVLDRLEGDLSFFREMDWSPFCVTNMERRLMDPTFDTVRPEIFSASKLVWSELVGRDYRRIGFVTLTHRFPDACGHPDDDERAAFGAWVATTGRSVADFPLQSRVPFQMPEGFAAWFEAHQPDAIVGFNSIVWCWLKELGLRTPKDVGFAALNLVEKPGAFVSGVLEHREAVAWAAADRMDQLFRRGVQGPSKPAVQILIAGSWREGETLRPREPRT